MPVEVDIPQPELPEEEPELARILRAPTLELGGENVEVSEKQNGSDGLDGVPVANTAPVEPNKPDEPEKTEPEKTEPEKTEAKKTDQEKPEEKKTDPEKTEPEKTEPEVPMVTRAEQQRFKKHKKGVETVQEEPEKVETKKSKGRGRGGKGRGRGRAAAAKTRPAKKAKAAKPVVPAEDHDSNDEDEITPRNLASEFEAVSTEAVKGTPKKVKATPKRKAKATFNTPKRKKQRESGAKKGRDQQDKPKDTASQGRPIFAGRYEPTKGVAKQRFGVLVDEFNETILPKIVSPSRVQACFCWVVGFFQIWDDPSFF